MASALSPIRSSFAPTFPAFSDEKAMRSVLDIDKLEDLDLGIKKGAFWSAFVQETLLLSQANQGSFRAELTKLRVEGLTIEAISTESAIWNLTGRVLKICPEREGSYLVWELQIALVSAMMRRCVKNVCSNARMVRDSPFQSEIRNCISVAKFALTGLLEDAFKGKIRCFSWVGGHRGHLSWIQFVHRVTPSGKEVDLGKSSNSSALDDSEVDVYLYDNSVAIDPSADLVVNSDTLAAYSSSDSEGGRGSSEDSIASGGAGSSCKESSSRVISDSDKDSLKVEMPKLSLGPRKLDQEKTEARIALFRLKREHLSRVVDQLIVCWESGNNFYQSVWHGPESHFIPISRIDSSSALSKEGGLDRRLSPFSKLNCTVAAPLLWLNNCYPVTYEKVIP